MSFCSNFGLHRPKIWLFHVGQTPIDHAPVITITISAMVTPWLALEAAPAMAAALSFIEASLDQRHHANRTEIAIFIKIFMPVSESIIHIIYLYIIVYYIVLNISHHHKHFGSTSPKVFEVSEVLHVLPGTHQLGSSLPRRICHTWPFFRSH